MPRAFSCGCKLLLGAIAVGLALMTAPANAERRVALVIGNGAYKHASVLPNSVGDAGAIASLLRKINFDVIEGADLDRDALVSHLSAFRQKAEGADVALLFYAGHGAAVPGRNYLIPVDAHLKSEIDLNIGALNVDDVIEQTMSVAKVKILLLDASRHDPWPPRRASKSGVVGLSDKRGPENTTVVFTTGAGANVFHGKPGEQSPFTRALIDHIAEAGLELNVALSKVRAAVRMAADGAQFLFTNTNMIGPFYMNPLPEKPQLRGDTQPDAKATVPGAVER
jgi:uncharacterized caspase-like protein